MIIGCRLGNVSLLSCCLVSVCDPLRFGIRFGFSFCFGIEILCTVKRQSGEWLEILTRNWSIWWRGKTTLESLTICVGNSIYVSEILINLPARRVSLGVSISPLSQPQLPFISVSVSLFVYQLPVA